MTDMKRVTKLAEECEARAIMYNGMIYCSTGDTVFGPEELLAFEQAVLAKRDEEHHSALVAKELEMSELSGRHLKQIDSLRAKLAMQAEALNLMLTQFTKKPSSLRDTQARGNARVTLKATQEDVDAFTAKKKAEWELSMLTDLNEMALEYGETCLRGQISSLIEARGE